MKRLVIFASGSGTNAENLIQWSRKTGLAEVVGICCNVANAGVIDRAAKYNVPVEVFNRQDWNLGTSPDSKLREWNPDLIVLAGFLWLFPARLLHAYPNKVINIHPALLPKYGGKGMYGQKVHEAVVAAGERTHGVTVHFVNEAYDEGAIILQESFQVPPGASAETLATRIHDIEYRILPKAIKKVLKSQG